MGNSSSSLDTSGPSPPSKALHVLRVSPGSPAAQTDIDPFFDFVVGIDNDELSSNVDAATLGKLVEEHEGKTLPLVIWSAKYRNMRVVPVVPSREWSQDSNSAKTDAPPSLLGMSMRVCRPEHALDNVWHILEVLENSPAESAGLVPYGDWILGWSGGVLSGENAFYELVEAHIDKPLRAVVYSYDFDTIREVVLVPNRKWGGEGLLGCGVGYGLLHRIPPQPMNSEAMDTILKQNLPYDEQDPFGEQPRKEDLDTSTLFIPADDENFEFGGVSGQPKSFVDEHSPSPHDDFDETPMAHWHSVNSQQKDAHPPQRSSGISHEHHNGDHAQSHDHGNGDHSHSQSHSHSQPHSHSSAHEHRGHGHSHDHNDGDHSHSHSNSPTSQSRPQTHSHAASRPPPSAAIIVPAPPQSRRTDSVSSLKSNPPISPPPRASTPTQSGVPTLSHTFAYREARNGSFNGIIKPEPLPLRRLSSPPAAIAGSASSRQRMRGGIVHSPAGSGAGTPTRVKSPDAAVAGSGMGALHARAHDTGGVDQDDDASDSTSRRPGSAGGSITSVD